MQVPAGTFEKLESRCKYGADVFVGGQPMVCVKPQSGNFTMMSQEGIEYAYARGADASLINMVTQRESEGNGKG